MAFDFMNWAGPLVQLLSSSSKAESLRGKLPSAPVATDTAPRGTDISAMRPMGLSGSTSRSLGFDQWPAQPGPDFVTEQALNDTARQYEADKDRRALEELALSNFRTDHGEALSNFSKRARGAMTGALTALNPQLNEAISGLRSAGAKANTGLRATVQSLNQAVKEINSQYEESLANLHTAKAEFMGVVEERTAGLLLDTVKGMDARGRAEYEDAVSGMRAAGAPESMVQAVGFQIRTQTAQAIGDQVAETRSRRMNEIENQVVQLDTNIANFETTFTNAFTGARTAIAGEAAAAYGGWAGTQADLAKAETLVRRDYSEMRGRISSDFATLESVIRQAHYQGAVYEAELLKGMTIPIFYAAPIADAQMAYFIGEAQQTFANEQAQFAQEAGLDGFEHAGVNTAVNTFYSYDIAKDQIQTQENIAQHSEDMGIVPAALAGVGSILPWSGGSGKK